LRLLPHFDPYLLAHTDKDHLVSRANYKNVYRKAGWISPVILLNGSVFGTWSHKRKGGKLVLKIDPFEKFTKAIKTKIEEEAVSLGRFLELPCVEYILTENISIRLQ
jgi:hypothetical protein